MLRVAYNESVARVQRLDPPAREAVVGSLSAALADRTDVSFAYLFGSFLEADGFRDVDVGIWTRAEFRATVDVELSTQLSQVTRLPVDVRRINDAPLPFLFHVLRGRLLSVRDEAVLAELLERVPRAYHDIAPLLRRATRDAFAASR